MPVDYRPIFSGQFIKWNREFGFITPADRKVRELFTHMSGKRGIYAHISKKIGTKQIKDKYSTKCLFAVGLDPHDYLKEKIYPSALVWILEDEVGDIQQYLRSRHEYLSNPNNLQEFLNADWYVNDWKKKAKCNPLRKIELDNQLLLVTENKETNIDTANELHKWLSQKTQSPFFAINEEEKHAILLKGWKNVCLKDNEYFRDFSLNNFSELCKNKIISTDDISDTLSPELFKANSISVDIESDGKNIYQIGYATTSERKLFDCSKNDFLSEIRETDIAAKEKSHWLVGHNIIAWDLPVLKGKRGNYFSTKIVWDTLLLSWILAPWERTHALVNKEEAHQADSDAKASLDLFYRQINQFPTEYVLELTEKVFEPVEFLFRNPNILFDTDKDRDYPEVPAYLNDDKNKNRSIIIPNWRLAECAWCSNVAFVWPEDHLDEMDCRIDLEALERLAAKDRDIWVRALTVVVRDAEKNNVQVLLRMTPRWLRDRIQRKLQDGRCLIKNHITAPEKINITTYFAYHSKDDEIINQTLSSESVSCLFWEEGQFDLRVEPVALDNHYVADIPGLVTPHAGAMFHLNNINNVCRFLSENGLIREEELNGRQIWLTYDPANIRVATSSCWHLHKQRYFPLLQDIEDQSDAPIVDQDFQPTAIFPAWTMTQHGKHRIFKDFVPPTSSNRVQYWEDALLRLLSLESNQDFEGIYILLVSHPHEKDVVMAALSDYGATIPFEGAPLRHLERLRRGKYRFALDIIARADQWLLASESLDCEIQLVIESLPIYDWWICRSSAAGDTTPFLTDESEEDPTEDSEDEVCDSNQDTGTGFANTTKQPGVNKHSSHIILSQDAVQICIERFLKPWMSNTLKGYTPTNLPLILDCRFDQFNFSKSAHFTRHDFAIATLTATQKDQLLRLLREAMGDIERQNAPIDYETYRIFFKEHWGHEDFKQDTQRPAIEAIIPNDSDVLVRLPTGEGKSVLFQVPALVRGLKTQRLTIVITPLRALMADQVRSLWGMGFFQSVDYLSGDRDPWANSEVYQGIIDNRIKLLYIAPERFRVPRFKEALARRLENDGTLEYIVVDEAHCMSQWGFEFRPDYLYAISELWRLCRSSDHFSRFLLFSATVTDATRKDIERVTGITAGEYFKIRPEDMPHPIQPFIRLQSEDVQSKLYGADITSARLGFIEKKIKDTDLNRSALIVFVTRKRHAEELCALLEQSVKDGNLPDHTVIRYFHAGLPALERIEIYEEYNNRNVNVLICTKAFGMGMDISHIHRCIHLASPAYLEDYVQEVGRTGRGKEDREKAGLASVECNLLYDISDFDTNHTKIMESRITLPALVELWNKLICEARKYAYSNHNLCIIPVEKFDKFDRNTLRLSLFWLERFERIDILDQIYGLLKVRLQKEKLQSFAALGDGDQHRVAQAILQLYEPPPTQDPVSGQKGSIVEKVLGFVGNILGILFSTGSDSLQTKVAEEKIDAPLDIGDEAEIHVGNIWQITNLPHMDDIFKALYELQKKGLLSIERPVEFDNRSFSKDRKLLWEWLNLALGKILVKTPEAGRQMSHEDMLAWMTDNESEKSEQNWGEQKIKSARQRVIKSTIALCSASSFRIFESYDDEGKLTYTYTLSKNKISFVRSRVQDILEIAVKIADRVEVTQRVTFTDLLSCCGKRIDFKNLKVALHLLSNLGICANKQELLSQSYILDLKNTTPLEHEDFSQRDREIRDELEKCNDMARLRSLAMELYALLPDEHRNKYIHDYFSIGTPGDLMDFLAKTVDAVADENPNLKGGLLDLRDGARQGTMKDELDNLSPEEQRPICELPYQDKFLVNAGPGSGKTRVLIMRCAHLIHHQGIKPNEILVLAFNRAVVHEIRERIIDLFTRLRYGSYVKKLNVYTFHAFAKREMQMNIVSDEDALGMLLHSFAEKLRTDDEFRTQVAGRYRAILVDEFQDMNDDFYSVIMSLQQGSGAGLMVIGDDDQDILLWERLKKQHARLHAVDYFETFNRDMANNHIRYLTTNYRSTSKIVDRSQKFVNRILSASADAKRLKTMITLEANPENAARSDVQDNLSLEGFMKKIPDELKEHKEIAILCRTNAEVFQTVKKIIDSEIVKRDVIVVQNDIQFKLADIRESAEWLDICRRKSSASNTALTDALYSELIGKYRSLGLPQNGETLIDKLWEVMQAQYRNPTLQMHIEFIEDLSTSDFERISRRQDKLSPLGRLIISTIHKVKGLEFDTVFINKSDAKFPLSSSNNRISDFAADEARLFYVAMTRAKSSLYFSWGDREKAWSKMKTYKGQTGQSYLEGKQDEVFISWPGYTPQYERGLQDYIVQKVSIRDKVEIKRGGDIYHQRNKIGRISQSFLEKIQGASWEVSSVIRYKVTEKYNEGLHPKIKQKGWLYTVLVRNA